MQILKKLVIVSNGGCGKTSLLVTFSTGTFPEANPIFSTYVADIKIDEKHVDLTLWDTGRYDRLLPLSYPNSNVVLICFAVDNPSSLQSVLDRWIGEVRHHCPYVPVVLLGCKKDLRDDPNTIEGLRAIGQHPVTYKEGMAVAQKIGAKLYLECSAKAGEGVHEVFQHAARVALLLPEHRKKKCTIL